MTRFLRARLRSAEEKDARDTRGSNFKEVKEDVCLDFPTLYKTAEDGHHLPNSCLCKGRGNERGREREGVDRLEEEVKIMLGKWKKNTPPP
jgi:hypothetical protein